jgi:hypothetical protein
MAPTDENGASGSGPDATDADAADESPVRTWLVAREVDSRNLLTLTYATPDGARFYRRQQSADAPGPDPTAARRVDAADLRPVVDAATRERYADEAARMAARHDPDDRV